MKKIDRGGLIVPILRSEGMQQRRRLLIFAGSLVGHIATRRGVESTGVGQKGDEPISESLGEIMKCLAFSASMATDLALVEDQCQSIGQKPDHGQHHQGRGLMDSGVFEVAVGGDSLKNFRIDSPTATTELMDEQRRD